jgi:2-keto-4-pentenoate hydratase/2-oxohepta-3-ene-1,7-dioic acid hydratase in catechol pathway
MHIARFRVRGKDQPSVGLVEGDQVIELIASDGISKEQLVIGLLAQASQGAKPLLDGLASRGDMFKLSEISLEAPIPRPGKFLAIGLNFADHTSETGLQRPAVPVVFNKQSSCVTGPAAPIARPLASTKLDYEGELGVVIGRRCRHVPASRAREVIGGYLIVNDVSVRDWQFATPTMMMGKGWDTHGPIGPWITTADEVADPHNLRIRTWVSGKLRQDGNTRDLLTDIGAIVAHLSTAFTLEPGDIIATGTPAGVGYAMDPPTFLRDGDVVRIEIDGLGAISNPVVDETSNAPCIT